MLYKVQFTVQGISGLSEDRYVNSLYFTKLAEATGAEIISLVAAATKIFSEIVAPSTQRVSEFWSPAALTASDSSHRIKVYRMEDATPRVPIYDANWILPGMVSQAGLPAECAVCFSFQATKVSGTDQARRRGRIYVGPLGVNAAITTAGKTRPAAALIATGVRAMVAMAAAATTAGFAWVVHSPTTGPLAAAQVTSVWIDDAFDIQRRRGLAPATRTTGVVP